MVLCMRNSPLVVLFLAGCGASPPPIASAPRADLSYAIDQWTENDRAAVPTVTLARATTTRPQHTVRIERPLERLERSGPRIDVSLERARLSNALRLLADAADLGIVIGEGLDSEITVDLRRVRPLEAMRALAQAYDIDLQVIGRTIVARRVNGS